MDKQKTIKNLLNQHRGKIFSVEFVKRTTGEKRVMQARQGVVNGATPLKGGEWANGTAGNAVEHDLILVTDINLEKAGKHSRRSIPLESVTKIVVAGQTLIFEV